VRKHFPDVAGSESDSDAVTDANTNPHADANPDPDAHANPDADAKPVAESGRVQHLHHDHSESGPVDRRLRRRMRRKHAQSMGVETDP
jgi:hypothetical protein